GLAGDDEVSRKIRRDAWAGWWRNTDGATLLAAFRKRTLSPEDGAKVQALIDQLGDKAFSVRERAAAELVTLGPKVVPLLRLATQSADPERARRAEARLGQIAQREDKHKLPAAGARLLVMRKPAGAIEALLAYLPFADEEAMQAEVGKAVKALGLEGGKPHPAVVQALDDPLPLRRAVAA